MAREKETFELKDVSPECETGLKMDFFGYPDIRVYTRDLKRVKGKIWYKRWSKNPLPGNYLPDHFK
jgi:hypothetical protein